MRYVLGTGLGFAGVVVLMGESVFGGVGDSLMAQAALLGAAISYAFSAVFGRVGGMGVAPMQIATGQVTAAAVLLLPLVVLVDRPLQLPPPGGIRYWRFWAWHWSQRPLPMSCISGSWHRPALLSLVTMLVPPTAILLGILVLGEICVDHLMGLMLIIAGLMGLMVALRHSGATAMPAHVDAFLWNA